MRTIFTWILFLLLPSCLYAAEQSQVALTTNTTNLAPHSQFLFIEDSETITLSDLERPELKKRFQNGTQRVLNFGLDAREVWVKVIVNNTSEQTQLRVLAVAFDILKAKVYTKTQSGEVAPITRWRPKEWEMLYRIPLPPGKTEIYVRSSSPQKSAFILKLFLKSEEAYWDEESHFQSLNMLYFGAALALGVYNLFLFFSLRSYTYLLYVLLIPLNIGYIIDLNGVGMKYGLWPASSNPMFGYAFGLAYVGALVLFSTSLLNTKQNCPRWDKVLKGFVAITAIYVLSTFLLPISKLAGIGLLLGTIYSPLIVIASILVFKKERRLVTFFLIGWLGFFITGIHNSMTFAGVPISPITISEAGSFVMLSALFELIIFSLALADRINSLSKEKIRAQKELVSAGEKYASTLEVKVDERTKSLRQANNTKDKFFSIISHDLRGPVGSLSVILNDVIEKPADIEEDLLEGMQKTSKNIYALLNQLLDWARSQQGHLEIEPKDFTIAMPAIEMAEVLYNQANQKQITIRCDIPESVHVYADLSTVSTVLRNLLSNAIKFTSDGGTIILSAEKAGDMVKISVADNGKGMNEETCKKIFLLG